GRAAPFPARAPAPPPPAPPPRRPPRGEASSRDASSSASHGGGALEGGEDVVQVHHVAILGVHVEEIDHVGQGHAVGHALAGDHHAESGGHRVDYGGAHAAARGVAGHDDGI